MNLHQFRFVQEAVRRNLNLTETAKLPIKSKIGIQEPNSKRLRVFVPY